MNLACAQTMHDLQVPPADVEVTCEACGEHLYDWPDDGSERASTERWVEAQSHGVWRGQWGEYLSLCEDCNAADIDEWGDPEWTDDTVQCRDCHSTEVQGTDVAPWRHDPEGWPRLVPEVNIVYVVWWLNMRTPLDTRPRPTGPHPTGDWGQGPPKGFSVSAWAWDVTDKGSGPPRWVLDAFAAGGE